MTLLIETLVDAKLKGEKKLQAKGFAKQIALKTGIPKRHSPFTAPDFQEAFDRQKMLELNG